MFMEFNRFKACRHGTMLYNVNDAYVGKSFELYGEFSQGETELFGQILEPGNIVLEVGANIGAHTLFLAKAVGPQGAVLAFEPQRVVFQTLCANMALNSITNVRCQQAALGRGAGQPARPAAGLQPGGQLRRAGTGGLCRRARKWPCCVWTTSTCRTAGC